MHVHRLKLSQIQIIICSVMKSSTFKYSMSSSSSDKRIFTSDCTNMSMNKVYLASKHWLLTMHEALEIYASKSDGKSRLLCNFMY